MAEDAGNNQNVDPSSTPSGPSAPDITLDQARVLALHTADVGRSTISRAYRRSPLVFAIEYEEENETHFLITIRFQAEGKFGGSAGLEEISIGKDGVVESRRVLRQPIQDKSGLPVLPIVGSFPGAGALAIIIVILVAVGAFDSGDDDQGVAVAATATPEPTPSEPTQIPTSTPGSVVVEDPIATPGDTPPPAPTPTLATAPTLVPTLAPTPTTAPTSTPLPGDTPTPEPTATAVVPPTPTPAPSPTPIPVPTATPRSYCDSAPGAHLNPNACAVSHADRRKSANRQSQRHGSGQRQ